MAGILAYLVGAVLFKRLMSGIGFGVDAGIHSETRRKYPQAEPARYKFLALRVRKACFASAHFTHVGSAPASLRTTVSEQIPASALKITCQILLKAIQYPITT